MLYAGFCLSSNPLAWGRAIHTLKCKTVYLTKKRSMKVPVSFRTTYRRTDKILLVDSGATDNFMDPRTVKHFKLGMQKLGEPPKIWNINGHQ